MRTQDNTYRPPYTITDTATRLVAEIGEKVGAITAWQHMETNPRLRRDNRIRSIHASLAIESNSLSLEQVTDIIDGKRVLGPPNEIHEVRNSYEAYEKLLSFNPHSVNDLLEDVEHPVIVPLEAHIRLGTRRDGHSGEAGGLLRRPRGIGPDR